MIKTKLNNATYCRGGSRLDTTPAVPVKKDCGGNQAEQLPTPKEIQLEDQAEQPCSQAKKEAEVVLCVEAQAEQLCSQSKNDESGSDEGGFEQTDVEGDEWGEPMCGE